ncbi:hypothetical protein HY095_00620 [Candidatus Micrarchaeota archaeon]|nr:hypothetical protein [Candidatus Micrarchaeota archaeon]
MPMRNFLQKLFETENVQLGKLELKVMPLQNSMAILGLMQLRSYAPFGEGEARFEGGESRQIREFLQALLPQDTRTIVQVKRHPSMCLGKETCYEFTVSIIYATSEELRLEEDAMLQHGWIAEKTYPILPPSRRSKWIFVDATGGEVEHREIPGAEPVVLQEPSD